MADAPAKLAVYAPPHAAPHVTRPTSRAPYAVGLRATQCARLLRPLRRPCPSSAISRADRCSFGGYGRVAGGAGPWSGPVRRGYPGKRRPRRIAARARPGCRARAWRRWASLTPESARPAPAGCAGAGRGRGGPRRGGAAPTTARAACGAVCGQGLGRGRATAAVPGRPRKSERAPRGVPSTSLGGETRIRTGDKGFAGLCLTTWPSRQRYEKGRYETGPIKSWSGLRGSNPRPPPWQGGALPTALSPRRRD